MIWIVWNINNVLTTTIMIIFGHRRQTLLTQHRRLNRYRHLVHPLRLVRRHRRHQIPVSIINTTIHHHAIITHHHRHHLPLPPRRRQHPHHLIELCMIVYRC